jgi:hypothetical protein
MDQKCVWWDVYWEKKKHYRQTNKQIDSSLKTTQHS